MRGFVPPNAPLYKILTIRIDLKETAFHGRICNDKVETLISDLLVPAIWIKSCKDEQVTTKAQTWREEIADFWDTHSLVDHWDETKLLLSYGCSESVV